MIKPVLTLGLCAALALPALAFPALTARAQDRVEEDTVIEKMAQEEDLQAEAEAAATATAPAAAPAEAAAPAAPAPELLARKWEMLPVESSLTFEGSQMGTAFKGAFKTFTADINFDPKDLGRSKVVALVDLSSIDSQDSERDNNLKGHEFFNVKEHPTARFETTAIRSTGPETYKAEGNLTIGAVTAPVTLPFTLTITPDDSGKETALMKGETTINRATWKIGTGDWTDPGVIANDVKVNVVVAAVNNPQMPAGEALQAQ
jgi:polyisoprenoid-binding protein YceI